MDLKRKYKANTLPEVLIALAITSFCSALAVMIYLNIQKSTMPFMKIKGGELAEKYLSEMISKKDFFDNSFKEEGYLIKKTVLKNPIYYDCLDIKIVIFNTEQKKVSEIQTTVHAE